MADVVKQINTTIPALKTVSFQQDSAGCYHCRACRATIVCAGVLGAELGVVLQLLAPFPPHGGNGACDRKAGGRLSWIHLSSQTPDTISRSRWRTFLKRHPVRVHQL